MDVLLPDFLLENRHAQIPPIYLSKFLLTWKLKNLRKFFCPCMWLLFLFQVQREQIDIMRAIRMDIGRLLYSVQNKDPSAYAPTRLEEKGVQADVIKEEKPRPIRRKQEVKTKEIDPEVTNLLKLLSSADTEEARFTFLVRSAGKMNR